MQNTAAALDFQYTSRYNKVYFDPEGGIFLNRMLGYLKGYERESVLAPLFKMLEATFDLFVPLVMADIVNVGIAAHDLHYILVRCGLLLLLAFIGLTCSLTAQYFSAKAAVGYSTALRHALFAHIQSLSFSEMDTLGTSTLITRMTSDVNQVQSGLNLFLRLFLRSPFVVLGAMVMAFTVNARAAMIFVVTIPLLSVVVFGVMVVTRPLYKTVQTRLDRVLGLTRENLTGVRVVRAFDKEQSEIDRFEDANERMQRRNAEEAEKFQRGGVRLGDHARAQARIAMDCIDEILGAGSSARLGLNENYMAPIYDVIEELGNAFAAEKQRYAAKPAQPMNREQRRAEKKHKHGQKPQAVSFPAQPPAARMVERVDAQVSAKQKTEQLIDARQAVNALRDDPDAMQQLAEYALQLASERHV